MVEILGHELRDWLPQEIDQGPPLPEFLNIYWPWYTPPTAEFQVSDLTISPGRVNPGQTVTIYCTVTNIGGEAGAYTVVLSGDISDEQTVTLQPDVSKVISFYVIPTELKTYHIEIDGQSGSFRVVETPVADIRLGDLQISPVEVYVGEEVTISAQVTNYGEESGSYTVKLSGDFTGSKSLTLQPGESKAVSFKVTPSTDKTYEVSMDGQSGSFRASAAPAADIRAEGLDISPVEVYVGEEVTISTQVTNYGGATGSYTVKLSGDFTGSKSLTLQPGESKLVSFKVVPTAVKTYEVSLDGQSGAFWVSAAPEADIRVEDLDISPSEVYVGEEVTISVEVTNYGEMSGTHTVKLSGDFTDGQSVTLQPGESKAVSFKVTPFTAKTYEVSVNGQSGSFRAVETPVADIRVGDLEISPSEAYVGEEVTISVQVTNYGTAAGSKTIAFTVT
jgi:uncharacterized membrane protein